MRAKSITVLNRHADPLFFEEISRGCRLIHDNSQRLGEAAEVLATRKMGRASKAVRIIAEEEAAKYLILLDAVRCPPMPQIRRAEQLRRFNDHLAKGIYVQAYDGRPASVGEVIGYIYPLRRSHYLDGPNDVDWIWRNEISQQREGALYVDYVETDNGADWWSPGGFVDEERYTRWTESRILNLVDALHTAGVGEPSALKVVAETWRQTQWNDDDHFQKWRRTAMQTLERLEGASLLTGSDRHHSQILETWLFPLFDVEMTLLKVSMEELREEQRRSV